MGKRSIAQGDGPCKDIFTASELAEMARFDAALEAEEIFLTKEERALSAALDREARDSAEPLPTSAGKKARTKAWQDGNREKMLAYYAKYNEAHRQERRDYQKAYDAAHRAEINAKRRLRYAARKRKEKEHG